jgi:hypothetical protein
MSISDRRLRATLFTTVDIGTQGETDQVYLIVPSAASDQAWWATRAIPRGDESTVGVRPEHRVDAVIELSAAVPIDSNSAIIIERGTTRAETYMVRSILRRDYGRDVLQVLAERVADRVLTTT